MFPSLKMMMLNTLPPFVGNKSNRTVCPDEVIVSRVIHTNAIKHDVSLSSSGEEQSSYSPINSKQGTPSQKQRRIELLKVSSKLGPKQRERIMNDLILSDESNEVVVRQDVPSTVVIEQRHKSDQSSRRPTNRQRIIVISNKMGPNRRAKIMNEILENRHTQQDDDARYEAYYAHI